jgi:putative transcriptional regulator
LQTYSIEAQYSHNEQVPAFILAVFAKNEQANLTRAETNMLGNAAKMLARKYWGVNMARIAFEKIMAGLEDAMAYADGDSSRGMPHQVKVADVDITNLREKLGLSQDKFAALFGLSPRTLRNWEQGVRHPEGPARILLQVIDREPEAVMRALRG